MLLIRLVSQEKVSQELVSHVDKSVICEEQYLLILQNILSRLGEKR